MERMRLGVPHATTGGQSGQGPDPSNILRALYRGTDNNVLRKLPSYRLHNCLLNLTFKSHNTQ